jgi:uncharacterized protein YfbU (UPF0304 family)
LTRPVKGSDLKCWALAVARRESTEIDPDFIADAILGGHYWALDWQYSGLFHEHVDSREVVHKVVDILDMWSFLEEGYEALSGAEKAVVAKNADSFGSHVTFLGFDGNNEGEYGSIARFQRFKGRDLNTHMPIVERYQRMYGAFEPIRKTLVGRRLSADEIVKILTQPPRRKVTFI